jgi:pimeloyl-ACP methyl ester carboxylesterase
MPTANVNGVSLYYETETQSQGDWIVFAHGGGGMHLAWWKQVAALRPHYRCLTYDARGHGMSSQGSPYREADEVASDDLVGLMDHVGIEKAFLNGHSMGGWAVSETAQRHPDRALGLVMTCCAFGFKTAALQKWAAGMIEKVPKGFHVLDHSYAPDFKLRDPAVYYLQNALHNLSPPRAVPRDSAAYLDPYRRMRDRKPEDYSKFAVPTLFVAGDHDELQVPWLIKDTQAAVANSKLVVIPGSGHCPTVERTEIYNQALIDFMESVRPKKA